MGIAVIPLQRRQRLHPGRRDHGETVERGAEGLPNALQPIAHADGAYHMGGVRPLPAVGFQQPLRTGHCQKGLEEQGLDFSGNQPSTELAQDGMVEARISEF